MVTLAATDPEEDPVTFDKTGGADEALFVIENGNELVFTEAAPDYVETDDNEYLVRVIARDNAGGNTAGSDGLHRARARVHADGAA